MGPTAREIVEQRLTVVRSTIDAAMTTRGAILEAAAAAGRGMTTEERASRQAAQDQLVAARADETDLSERLAEIAGDESRAAVANAARAADGANAGTAGVPAPVGGAQVTDAPIYHRGLTGRSYFRDLAKASIDGDSTARENLSRSARATADELQTRALGNTNTTGGSGGEFAPPLWLVEDYVKLARAGRVTADLMNHSDVPMGVSSVNLPKVLSGTVVSFQTTQNTALAQTDLTTGAVGTGFTTLGGKQVVSQQLLDQSEIDFDRVVTTDLAADYARSIGAGVLLGAGTGTSNSSGVINGLANTVVPAALQGVYTAAAPTAQGFYSKCAGLIAALVTARFEQPTVWLMHPRRFYWLIAQVDSQGRPLVVPAPMARNGMGTLDSTPEAGNSGMTFLGLPVYIDPQIPTNLGTGSNQDEVFLLKQDDLWFFESPVQAESFRAPYADTLGVLFRLYAYVGTILNRYSTSIATLNGTGLIAPTF
jgi:HK97 family phage major capsid protein